MLALAPIVTKRGPTDMKEAIPCIKCGGKGTLIARPNIYTLQGELYTVDCEDCGNSTSDEYVQTQKAIEQWNIENTVKP